MELRQAGGVALVLLLTVGPVFGLLLLLNARDRRHAALLGLMWELTPRNLAGLIAIQVRCTLCSSRSEVTVDMQACSRDEIWEAIGRWSPHLPARARLLVKGTMDGGRLAHITLGASRQPSASFPSRRVPVPG